MTTTTDLARVSDDYAATGLSFTELMDLDRDERNALLARVVLALQSQIAPLAGRLKEAELLLKQDLFENQATLIDAGEFEVTEEKRQKWEYDIEGLRWLKGLVPAAVYDRCIHEVTTWEVSKAELNKLKKLGANVKAIIDDNCQQVTTSSKIVVTRKPRVIERDDRPSIVYGKTEVTTGRELSA